MDVVLIHQVLHYLDDGGKATLTWLVTIMTTSPLGQWRYFVNGRREAAIIDLTLTHVQGKLVQVCAWYDNETGYANRLLDWLLALSAQPLSST